MSITPEKASLYQAVFRQTSTGWSGFFPDLPGAVATGKSKEQILERLSEALALHLYDMEQEGDHAPLPHSYEAATLKGKYSDAEFAKVSPAELNPLSLEIGKVIDDSGKSLRQIESETGIKYSVLSRLQDPFYWGHSLRSVLAFAQAFGLKTKFEFIAA